MHCETKNHLRVILNLNAREALWLKRLAQNYNITESEPETEVDRVIREDVFRNLPPFNVLEAEIMPQ